MTTTPTHTHSADDLIGINDRFGAANYAPLEVVITRGEGAFVWDVEGTRYVDMLSAYSAVNQGHCHPRLVKRMQEQAARLTLTSRAFHNDVLPLMLEKIAGVTGMERVLPMNTGAEAVETAIKAMRRYGYEKRGIAADAAEIIVFDNNFHGRTTTIVGFSSDPDTFGNFGPFTPGFVRVPYGDAAAATAAVTPNTVGILLEPIQGEAGVIVPPDDFLPALRKLCDERELILCVDEIQTGLGRTGRMFCFEHSGVRPDLLVIGKALAAGMYPVSACAGHARIMDVFTPGSHGSTFGGCPLAAAMACEALDVLIDEKLAGRAEDLGQKMRARLRDGLTGNPALKEVRGKGLLIAVEFGTDNAKAYCKALKAEGVLAKDTHQTTIRFAPPLVIGEDDLMAATDTIIRVLNTPLG